MLYVIFNFFLIVSSFSFGDFEECWYFVSKWYEIQWLLKITTACRVSDLTIIVYLTASCEQQWKMFEKVNEDN